MVENKGNNSIFKKKLIKKDETINTPKEEPNKWDYPEISDQEWRSPENDAFWTDVTEF